MEMRDILRIAVGTIILLVLIMIFVRMFSVPKCDGMANETVTKLAYEIEKVDRGECFLANDPNVRCPCNDPERCYAAVQVKLCQSNLQFGKIGGILSNAMAGGSPEYQIYYNSPPGEDAPWWAPWTETYPWSGGAASGLVMYSAIRYGPKLAKWIGIGAHYGIGRAGVRLSGKLTNRNSKILQWLGRRIENMAITRSENKRVAKMLKIGSKAKLQNVEDDVYRLEKFGVSVDEIADDIAKGADESTVVNTMKSALKDSGLDEIAAKREAKKMYKFLKVANKLKEGEDTISILDSVTYLNDQIDSFMDGKILLSEGGKALRDYKGRYIISPEYRKLFRSYMYLLPEEEARVYRSIFYAPMRRSPFTFRYRIWRYLAGTKLGRFASESSKFARKVRAKIFARGVENGASLSKQQAKELVADMKLSLIRKNHDEYGSLLRELYDDPIARQRLEEIARKYGGEPYTELNFYRLLNDQEELIKANNWNLVVSGDTDIGSSFKFDEVSPMDLTTEFNVYKDNVEAIRLKNLKERAINYISDTSAADKTKKEFIDKIDKADSEDLVSSRFKRFLTNQHVNVQEATRIFDDEIKNVVDDRIKLSFNIRKTSLDFSQFYVYDSKTDSFVNKFYKPVYNELKTDAYLYRSINIRNLGGAAIRMNRMKAERLALTDFLIGTPEPISKPIGRKIYEKISPYGPRIRRVLWFDLGKSYNPIWPGSNMMTRIVEESLPSSGNALILTKGGTESVIIPLNISRTVRFPRRKFGYTQLGIQTQLWQMSPPPENPRFYAVSPCFGIAKIWKKGGTIWVKIEKCDAENGGKKCSNYCYADEEYVWGSSGADDYVTKSFGVATGVGAGVYSASMIACSGTCSSAAALAAKYAAIGSVYGALGVADKSDWGYWDYYKMADVCDAEDYIWSAVGFGAGKALEAKKGLTFLKLGKMGERVNSMVSDVCMGIYVIGEQELAWPGRGEKIALPEKSIDDATLQCIAEHG